MGQDDQTTGARLPPLPGRGAGANPPGRFESRALEDDPEWRELQRLEGETPRRRTRFHQDQSRSVLSWNDSPDLPFRVALNPYRGCEHGCAYCYARPTHEYHGLSAGLDFESEIFFKPQAPALLTEALSRPDWEPQVIALSGVTDAYQPVERRLEITRRCLEVLLRFRNPVGIVTKNDLVLRDLDLLKELAAQHLVHVTLSVTSLDAQLSQRLEPRAAPPQRRLEAISALAQAGVPVGVLTAPAIPGLNDHELPAILEHAAQQGAQYATYILLRLPHGVKAVFSTWLQQHRAGEAEKVLNAIRAMRGGNLNETRFGVRKRGEGVRADALASLFELTRRKLGLMNQPPVLATRNFQRPAPAQGSLF